MRTSAPQTQQAYTLPPDKYQAAIELNRQVDILYFVGVAWSIVVILLFRRFRVRAPVPALALLWLSSLPLSLYRHHLGLSYRLSVEPWAPWLWDWFKAGAIATGITVLLALAGLALARRVPRRWWLYAWILSVAVMAVATYAVPLLFDPLFHNFKPLVATHPELIAPVQQVAARAGQPVPADRIFEMDASEKTRTLNAYMTGFGATKRIVLWDTTIRRLTPPQIQTVFAHELGHYALHHVPRSIALAAVALFILFFLFRHIRTDDFPRLLLIVTLLSFFSEPVVNSYSRWQEHEADVYELRIMSGLIPNAGANSAEVDQIMAEISLDDPAPSRFVKFWLYDHPATDDRMRFARQWDLRK